MATRKQMRKRTRKQRGGRFFNAIADVAEKIKGFFSKPTDSSAPSSPGVKQGPLLKSPTTESKLPSNAIAISIPPTPSPQPVMKVNSKPLTPSTTIGVATPQSTGLTGSFTGPIVSLQQPSHTAVQIATPNNLMQSPKLTLGGRRKKHRHTRKCKKINKKCK